MRWWLYKYLFLLFVLSLLIQTSYGNANESSPYQYVKIEVNDTNNVPVKEATIEASVNESIVYLYTDENGVASFVGEQNKTYTFRTNSENYENKSKNITILPGISNLKFTLTPLKNKKDSEFWPIFIPAIAGFFIFIYWFINHYSNDRIGALFLVIVSILSGITILSYLFLLNNTLAIIGLIILILFLILFLFCMCGYITCCNKQEESFTQTINNKLIGQFFLTILILSWPGTLAYLFWFGKETVVLSNVRFSIYIFAAALIGIISYLLYSIEESFTQTITKQKKKSIIWGYIRRITVAPYIALLGVYVLLDAAKIQNIWFILLFSFITGMFTKTIEEKLYKSVQGLLTEEGLKEFKEREEKYSIENSELVVRLGVDEDVAYELYQSGIRRVEQLAHFYNDSEKRKELKKCLKSINRFACLDLSKKIEEAKNQVENISKLKALGLTKRQLDLLADKAIYSIPDFARLDIESIDGIKSTEKEDLNKKQIKAKEIVKSEDLKLLSLEDLKELYDICRSKKENVFHAILNLHVELKKLGITNWSVRDTMKIIEIPVTTLKQLKEQCSNEENKKILQEKMKDNPRISELLEKILLTDINP